MSATATGLTRPDRTAQMDDGRRAPVTSGWRVAGPRRDDPRLRVAAAVITLQVLGQLWFAFPLSIPQLLLPILTCAAVDVAVVAATQRLIAWPASALLTGNGIALVLRASGTAHGEWWSLNGIGWFLCCALLAMASKHLLRPVDRHILNPSNAALVVVLLVTGSGRTYPQPLHWGGPLATAVADAVVVAAAVAVLPRLRLLPVVVGFAPLFLAGMAVVAATGTTVLARWSAEPLAGIDLWTAVCLSPELLVFTLLMTSDPRTTPRGPLARAAYGLVVAAVALALIAPQRTEYGVKLAVLVALTAACAVTPALDAWLTDRRPLRRPAAMLLPSALAVAAVAVLAPAATARLRDDPAVAAHEAPPPPPAVPGEAPPPQ